VPRAKHHDLDYLVEQLDWAQNTDPNFKANHYLEPIPVADTSSAGYMDRWICYGRIKGWQCVTAKELTVEPGVTCTVPDHGAYGLICVQGEGRINNLRLNCPKLIRFHDLTDDEVFVTEDAAKAGVAYENGSATEPMVVLRYFGPEVNPDAPDVGDAAKRR
jgi:hypothetical protein